MYRNCKDPRILGNYYTKHIIAMTTEELHEKSEIAMELAYRDMLLDIKKSNQNRIIFALEKLINKYSNIKYQMGSTLVNMREVKTNYVMQNIKIK